MFAVPFRANPRLETYYKKIAYIPATVKKLHTLLPKIRQTQLLLRKWMRIIEITFSPNYLVVI